LKEKNKETPTSGKGVGQRFPNKFRRRTMWSRMKKYNKIFGGVEVNRSKARNDGGGEWGRKEEEVETGVTDYIVTDKGKMSR